jgi:hypothetical protein
VGQGAQVLQPAAAHDQDRDDQQDQAGERGEILLHELNAPITLDVLSQTANPPPRDRALLSWVQAIGEIAGR